MNYTKKVLFMMIFFFVLIGCSSTEKESFIGIIEEIKGDQALVFIEEGEILNSGDQVIVDLSKASGMTFEKGDRIKVKYGAAVRESYPLGIDTIAVEFVNNE